jgi:16S rRNA (uracil1498-N3)-methyltransferase
MLAAELRAAPLLVYVDDLEAGELALSTADSRHLSSSLRLRPGDSVAAGDGYGRWRMCRIASAGAPRGSGPAGAVVLEPVTSVRNEERPFRITVGVSLVKGDRPEWAVAKMTEVGVDRILPMICDRTVVRSQSRERHQRLVRVAAEAAMQSRRVFKPVVEEPAAFDFVIDLLSDEGSLVSTALAEPGGGRPGADLRSVLVGPEGGFSPRELARAPSKISLGESILRTETAAVAAGLLLASFRSGLLAS